MPDPLTLTANFLPKSNGSRSCGYHREKGTNTRGMSLEKQEQQALTAFTNFVLRDLRIRELVLHCAPYAACTDLQKGYYTFYYTRTRSCTDIDTVSILIIFVCMVDESLSLGVSVC